MESVRTCFETCANLCQFRTWLIGVSFVCFFTANLNFAVFIWLIAAKHLSKDLQGFLAAKVVAFYLLGCAGLIVAWRPNDLVGYAVPVLAGLGAVFSFAFFIIETHEVLSEEKIRTYREQVLTLSRQVLDHFEKGAQSVDDETLDRFHSLINELNEDRSNDSFLNDTSWNWIFESKPDYNYIQIYGRLAWINLQLLELL